MNSKTYVIRVKIDDNNTEYFEIEQALYDLGVSDVDVLEEYDD